MKNLLDFSGGFGDFATLFTDTDLDEYVIRFFHNDDPDKICSIDGEAFFKVMIGYTEMPNGDILLHLIDAEGADTWDEIYENAERYGVEFQLLSKMLQKHGFEITPIDQVEWDDEDDDDDDDDGECWFCDGDDPDCPFCSDDDDDDDDDEPAACCDGAGCPECFEGKYEEFGEKMAAIGAAILLGGMFGGLANLSRYDAD